MLNLFCLLQMSKIASRSSCRDCFSAVHRSRSVSFIGTSEITTVLIRFDSDFYDSCSRTLSIACSLVLSRYCHYYCCRDCIGEYNSFVPLISRTSHITTNHHIEKWTIFSLDASSQQTELVQHNMQISVFSGCDIAYTEEE
jgi:hypothetical protein